MKKFLAVLVAVSLVLIGLQSIAFAQEKCPFSVSGTIEAGDGTQNGRLKNGAPSVCATPKAVPDVQNTTQTRRFDSYTLKNRSKTNACITAMVTATTATVPVASAAYLGSFDPTNPQANYLGDSGNVLDTTVSYSFLVPALQNFVITVNEIGMGGGTYDLAISDCGSVVATSVVPNAGPIAGGTAITITGSGFVSGATVTVGGNAATNVSVTNESTITATTPVGAAGPADVVVTNPDNATSTLTDGFLYVAPASTTLALTSSANPSGIGQSITFTATASSLAGTPTGSITFKDGTNTLGTGNLNGSGVATFSTSTLAIGTHPITAEYAGNVTFAAATSAVVSQVVTLGKSATSMVASANPIVVGNTVTFTIAVAAVAPATGVPTGTVNVSADGAAVGTAVALDANGKAAVSTASLTAGTHSMVATYSGDTKFSSSVSAPLSLVVNATQPDAGGSTSSSGSSGTTSSGGTGSSSGTASSTSSGAAASSSGNAANGDTSGGGGCDCRTANAGGGASTALAFLAAALFVASRRRRRH